MDGCTDGRLHACTYAHALSCSVLPCTAPQCEALRAPGAADLAVECEIWPSEKEEENILSRGGRVEWFEERWMDGWVDGREMGSLSLRKP